MKAKTLIPFAIVMLVICAGCRYAPNDSTESAVHSASFAHERRAALATDAWGGMRVEWTAVADWPVGDSSVARAVRMWIGERLRNYRREPFKGDTADWDALTRFHGNQFLAANKEEWRYESKSKSKESCPDKPAIDPGTDVFLDDSSWWFCRHSAILEYEDERIVSYRSGFYGFFVENSTSAAYVKCATFRKSDGKMLGWDVFSNTNAVFELVRKLAKIKFKEGADYAGVGVVPVPNTPLFTKDGFWVFWGDYAIVHGHVYEMNGAFPSLFVPWGDPTCGNRLTDNRETVKNLLTHEARYDLGLSKSR